MSLRTVSAEGADLIVRKLRATQPGDAAAAGIMREDQAVARRSYGGGSLFRKGSAWYGQWRVSGRLVKRRIGPMRQPGSREGLTRAQAERELQRRMEQETVVSGLKSDSPSRVAIAGSAPAGVRAQERAVCRKAGQRPQQPEHSTFCRPAEGQRFESPRNACT
jgi:hypothetical protein